MNHCPRLSWEKELRVRRNMTICLLPSSSRYCKTISPRDRIKSGSVTRASAPQDLSNIARFSNLTDRLKLPFTPCCIHTGQLLCGSFTLGSIHYRKGSDSSHWKRSFFQIHTKYTLHIIHSFRHLKYLSKPKTKVVALGKLSRETISIINKCAFLCLKDRRAVEKGVKQIMSQMTSPTLFHFASLF